MTVFPRLVLPDASALKATKAASSMAIATPLVAGANHCLGYRKGLLRSLLVSVAGVTGTIRLQTHSHGNEDYLLVAFYVDGITQSPSTVAFTIGSAATTTETIYSHGWHYASVATDGAGWNELKIATSNCSLYSLSAVPLPSSNLLSTDIGVSSSNPTYRAGGLFPEHYIFDEDEGSIEDLRDALSSGKTTLKRTMFTYGVATANSTSCGIVSTEIFPNNPLRFIGDEWRLTPVTSSFRLSLYSRVLVATEYTFSITIGGSTYTSATLTNGALAWAHLDTPTVSTVDLSKGVIKVVTNDKTGVVEWSSVCVGIV